MSLLTLSVPLLLVTSSPSLTICLSLIQLEHLQCPVSAGELVLSYKAQKLQLKVGLRRIRSLALVSSPLKMICMLS